MKAPVSKRQIDEFVRDSRDETWFLSEFDAWHEHFWPSSPLVRDPRDIPALDDLIDARGILFTYHLLDTGRIWLVDDALELRS